MELCPPTAALKAVLDAMPGAAGEPLAIPRTASPTALLYKIMGKMFAILSVKGDQFVILKCDPHLIEAIGEDELRGLLDDGRRWVASKPKRKRKI